jgi:hypothetical protein
MWTMLQRQPRSLTQIQTACGAIPPTVQPACVCVCVCGRACVRQMSWSILTVWGHLHAESQLSCVSRVCECVCVCVGGGVAFPSPIAYIPLPHTLSHMNSPLKTYYAPFPAHTPPKNVHTPRRRQSFNCLVWWLWTVRFFCRLCPIVFSTPGSN